MLLKKHLKLLRRFLGNIARPRSGLKKNSIKIAKFIYLLVEWPFELLGDVLFFWKRLGKGGIRDPRKILIVKVDQLGDVLFSTLLLPAIKLKYPGARIDYLVNPKATQILEGNPHVANVYPWENVFLRLLPGRGNKMSGILRLMGENRQTMRKLRAQNYDVVINARAFAPSSNIPLRSMGRDLIAFDISEQSFAANYWAEYDFDNEEWENYLNLLKPLGIDVGSAGFSEEFYNDGGPNPMNGGNRYVLVSPVSFDSDREWGGDNWSKLVSFIVSQGVGVAFTGMPAQKEHLESLASAGGDMARVFTGLRLSELGALMKGAEFFIGIDSFPAHLALAEGKRTVALVNPAAYYLKGYSPKRFAVDARNMLPVSGMVMFFDVRSAKVEDLKKAVKEIVGGW